MSQTHAELLFAAQRVALETLLPNDRVRQAAARRRITRAVKDRIQALAIALAPPVVAEVGAHEAAFSQVVKAALPGSRVVAMEANPEVFALHRQTAEASGVDYLHTCVSSQSGMRTFTVPVRADGSPRLTMGSLLADSRAVGEQSYEVASRTLDDLVGATDNVLWIDVEGGIGEVLESGAATLSHCQALYAEVETEQRWQGQWTDTAVIAHLAAHGLVPVLRDIQRTWQYNVLFVRESRLTDPSVRAACGL